MLSEQYDIDQVNLFCSILRLKKKEGEKEREGEKKRIGSDSASRLNSLGSSGRSELKARRFSNKPLVLICLIDREQTHQI